MTNTNFTRIRTCSSTGSTVAHQQPVIDGLVRIEALTPADYLGPNPDWDQRRAFEWGYLSAVAYRNGDIPTAEYCAQKVREIEERCGY